MYKISFTCCSVFELKHETLEMPNISDETIQKSAKSEKRNALDGNVQLLTAHNLLKD
jgi:hypothetical protein